MDSPIDLNDAGQIVFASQIVGDSLLRGFGLFFYDDSRGLLQVARDGDAMLGSTIIHLALSRGASQANVPAGPAGREFSPLNNRGQVLYSFELADGRSGVAIWTVPPLTNAELRITDTTIVSNDVRITWNTMGNSTNVIQASSHAFGNFIDISGELIIRGPGQVRTNFVEHNGATNCPARYYRIQRKP